MFTEIIQTSRILIVDDEPANIRLLERILQQAGYRQLESLLDPRLAINKVKEFRPDLILLDLMMPDVDGFAVMSQLHPLLAAEVYLPILVITADVTPAAKQKALSLGAKDFLAKPLDMTEVVLRIHNLLETRWLYRQERELLERTLNGSIRVLTEILSLVNPAAFSRAHRIRKYVDHMAKHVHVPDEWQFELAAMLSQIGCVVVPPTVMDRFYLRQGLSAEEQEILSSQGQIGHKLLGNIPRLERVAEMISCQDVAWSETAASSDPVKFGGHLLRVARDLDEQMMQGKSLPEALAEMRQQKKYNPQFLTALKQLQVDAAQSEIKLVSLSELRSQMIINADLYSKTGVLLLAKGQEVTESAIARLESFASLFGIAEPIAVIVPGGREQVPPADGALSFLAPRTDGVRRWT